MSIPKVSTVHQGFAGTFTHMDGNDGEEKERKRQIWRAKNKNIFDSDKQTGDTGEDKIRQTYHLTQHYNNISLL